MSERSAAQPEMTPSHLSLVCNDASISIEAVKADDAGDGAASLPRFRMIAYTGDAMRIAGWRHPVVVDLQGLNIPSQRRPIRFAHSAYQGIGHSERIAAEGDALIAEGVISRDTPAAREIVTSGKRGFPWQASIGAAVQQAELIRSGKFINVNGRQFEGPVYVARKTVLGEISFVDLSADSATSATIAANKQEHPLMPAPGNQTPNDTDATQTTDGPDAVDATAQDTTVDAAPDNVTAAANDPLQASRREAANELRRQVKIREVCGDRHTGIAAEAIEEGWTTEQAELAVLRASRPTGLNVLTRDNPLTTPRVLEAACLMTLGINGDSLLTSHGEQHVEAAQRKYHNRIGLKQLLLEAAWTNGCTVRHFDEDREVVLRAAFSTFSLPGILSNVANKFLLDSFNAVEQTWKQIAKTRSVNDFKQVTSYRMTGNFLYDEVGADGELKHAEVGEESFTNQARTFGKMFGLTRTDLINDNLNALTQAPSRIGRGAALTMNKLFWTEFLNNAAFFTTGDGNYKTGADTALSVDGLTAADVLFAELVDPDGDPLGISPTYLLVPPALKTTAKLLMSSQMLNETTTANKPKPADNPHVGNYTVLSSTYLSNANFTGSSGKAWYLLASPADLPLIEVVFLNGKQVPTVEQTDADFKNLGIQFRGYFDFGVALQDNRAGIKMKGEA